MVGGVLCWILPQDVYANMTMQLINRYNGVTHTKGKIDGAEGE